MSRYDQDIAIANLNEQMRLDEETHRKDFPPLEIADDSKALPVTRHKALVSDAPIGTTHPTTAETLNKSTTPQVIQEGHDVAALNDPLPGDPGFPVLKPRDEWLIRQRTLMHVQRVQIQQVFAKTVKVGVVHEHHIDVGVYHKITDVEWIELVKNGDG
jgi:hypothetical protein